MMESPVCFMVRVNEVVVLSLPRRAPHLGNRLRTPSRSFKTKTIWEWASSSSSFGAFFGVFLWYSSQLGPSGRSCFMLLNPPPTPLMLREVSGGAGPWRVLLGNLLDPDWIFLILTHVIWTVRFSDSVSPHIWFICQRWRGRKINCD